MCTKFFDAVVKILVSISSCGFRILETKTVGILYLTLVMVPGLSLCQMPRHLHLHYLTRNVTLIFSNVLHELEKHLLYPYYAHII